MSPGKNDFCIAHRNQTRFTHFPVWLLLQDCLLLLSKKTYSYCPFFINCILTVLSNRTFILDFHRIYTLLLLEFGQVSMFCPWWVFFWHSLVLERSVCEEAKPQENICFVYKWMLLKCINMYISCVRSEWIQYEKCLLILISVEHPVVYLEMVVKTMGRNQSIS